MGQPLFPLTFPLHVPGSTTVPFNISPPRPWVNLCWTPLSCRSTFLHDNSEGQSWFPFFCLQFNIQQPSDRWRSILPVREQGGQPNFSLRESTNRWRSTLILAIWGSITFLSHRVSTFFICISGRQPHRRKCLKGLSHEMEGGIKVVSVERSLKTHEPPRQKIYLVKGPVSQLHLKVWALCQNFSFETKWLIPNCGVFQVSVI